MQPVYFLVPAMLLSLLLLKLNQHYASPVLAIVNRWVRWGVMAGGLAQMFQHFGWSQRGFEVLFVVFLLVWFLIDGIYRWLAIHAMSVSPLPLFPRFALNRAGDEWPVQGRFLKLRDRLREAGFKQVQALRAEVATSLYLRMSVYQDADNTTRLQIAFLPQPMGNVTVCLHLATQTADGRRIVTDNHYLPFAGFYPENWLIERRPRTRSFARLLARHRNRVATLGGVTVPWTTEPLDDLNAQQAEIERINTDLGFLLPSPEHEEHGRISHEGRFRLWKEMLSLNYLGRAARYE
ncbi:MAG: hypothetical protein MUE42_10580 [Opitutaceae bacterium]|jgi:hypothetical protein|nr:hypothetical protein [Opitutaceae bacterium]